MLVVALALGGAVTLLLNFGPGWLDGFREDLQVLESARLPAGTAGTGTPSATTVFLVRHAEALYPPPEDAPGDPPLNRIGRARAQRLAEVLRDAGIASVLSTDLRRTLQTAGPLAGRLGLEIELYDPYDLSILAQRLAATPGRVLVAGHSNTTPELVRLLGGEPGEPIDERTEFDRLYVLGLTPGEPTTTLLLHYGEPPGTWPPDDPAALAEP